MSTDPTDYTAHQALPLGHHVISTTRFWDAHVRSAADVAEVERVFAQFTDEERANAAVLAADLAVTGSPMTVLAHLHRFPKVIEGVGGIRDGVPVLYLKLRTDGYYPLDMLAPVAAIPGHGGQHALADRYRTAAAGTKL